MASSFYIPQPVSISMLPSSANSVPNRSTAPNGNILGNTLSRYSSQSQSPLLSEAYKSQSCASPSQALHVEVPSGLMRTPIRVGAPGHRITSSLLDPKPEMKTASASAHHGNLIPPRLTKDTSTADLAPSSQLPSPHSGHRYISPPRPTIILLPGTVQVTSNSDPDARQDARVRLLPQSHQRTSSLASALARAQQVRQEIHNSHSPYTSASTQVHHHGSLVSGTLLQGNQREAAFSRDTPHVLVSDVSGPLDRVVESELRDIGQKLKNSLQRCSSFLL
jgi:hypothetical protein